MFTKYDFSLQMFVGICWSYGMWGTSIIRSSSTGWPLCGKGLDFSPAV